MIGWLSGRIRSLSAGSLILDVGGVGYEVFCCGDFGTLNIDDEREFVIHTDVREDQIRLFGFPEQLDKTLFLMLTDVKGVGSKHASEIIGAIAARELLRVISLSDVARLQTVRGVGKKTAERIVVELRDRVEKMSALTVGEDLGSAAGVRKGLSSSLEVSVVSDASAALEQLGFSKTDAAQMVNKAVSDKGASFNEAGELVRAALRFV